MAGLKETPRQKMIGMMYLVLTALLALNVQREILDSFITLNDGIEQTNNDNNTRKENLYSEFKFAYNLDPAKTTSYWESAQEISILTKEVDRWVDSLKTQIISMEEKIPAAMADTISLNNIENLDKYDESTRILVGTNDDGTNGKARELRNKINEFQSQINQILKNHNLNPISTGINFDNKTVEGVSQTWETSTFYDTPLAAVVALISKIQGDISTMEYTAVNELFSEIDGEDIPIDTIVARIIPSKKYVMLGDKYDSEIFLGAYSTTISPKMEITGNENLELEVVDGVGKYSFRPTRSGVYEYEGKITVTDKKGREKLFPFQSEFIAVPPTAVVSPTAMNVLYKGLKNPVSISVPGIEDESVIATITGSGNQLVKIGPGKYEVKLANGSPRDVSIKVSAKLSEGNIQNMGAMDFRAKFLPAPYASVGKIVSSGTMTARKLAGQKFVISKYSQDFIFDLTVRVTKFTVTFEKNGLLTNTKVTGNKFTQNLIDQIKKLRSGQVVYFEEIEAKGEDGKVHTLNSVKITIIN